MCEHNTTIVKYDQGNVQVEVCTWGCGQTIISVKRADAVTESFTAAELSTLRARVKALEWVVKRLEYIEEYPAEEMLCPICRGEKPTHYKDCELAAALK